MLSQFKKHTYEEFLELTKDIERAEFIDGEIFYLASPSPEHQRISFNIEMEFGLYLKNKKCSVYHAPLDVILENEEFKEKKSVQPDVMIVCDKSGFTKNNYTGIPTIIIEILSPSTTARDTIQKMDLYMKFKILEYWIVSPKSKTVSIYCYDDELNGYSEPNIYSKDDIIKSNIFKDLSMELKEIFK